MNLFSRAGAWLQALSVSVFLTPGAALAQNGPEPVATLLANIRVLKLECKVKPVPVRLAAVVAAAGYELDEFLPRGRYFGLVQAQLATIRAPSRSSRAEFCAQIAERVRTSPLNGPRNAEAGQRARTRPTSVNLNRASLQELNSLGAGLIGRRIIYGRPYSSPEDLLDRRVLNMRDFARVRDRVAVR
jgi:hypothetical protein